MCSERLRPVIETRSFAASNTDVATGGGLRSLDGLYFQTRAIGELGTRHILAKIKLLMPRWGIEERERCWRLCFGETTTILDIPKEGRLTRQRMPSGSGAEAGSDAHFDDI